LPYSEDYYAVLGALPSIEQTALSAVYKALCKKYHPDVYLGEKAEGEKITQKLNAAYAVLGDVTKRAEYDGERGATENGSGDYEQETYTSGPSQDEQQEKLENWDYATQFYPDAEISRVRLYQLSPRLSLTFQIILLENKSFTLSTEISEFLKAEFLTRYFGNNDKIQRFVEVCLDNDRRDVALEINKAIKIVGSPSKKEEERFLSVFKKKFNFYDIVTKFVPQSDLYEARLLVGAIKEAVDSNETLAELADFELDIAEGELEIIDLEYLKALKKRLLG
jgi:curved DNA-binding protein CbpA